MAETNIALILFTAASFCVAAFALFRRRSGSETSSLALLQGQLAQLSQQLNERMRETSGTLQSTQDAVGQRLDNTANVMALLERKLGQLEESSKRIQSLGEGLQELHDVLKSPKLRGNMGEFFLEELLAQILPSEHYRIQHAFKGGEIVDAAVKIGDGVVCIDSKFPLESFLRLARHPAGDVEGERRERRAFTTSVKKHADAIAAKYIAPDEGTFDFALMYIPAENVYYETIVRDEEDGLHSYLLSRKVIPVSPSSLYAYLQVIVLGLRGLKVEEQAVKISRELSRLGAEFGRFREEFSVLGRHLRNAAGSFDEGGRRLERLEGRLAQLDAPGSSKNDSQQKNSEADESH